MVVFDADLAEKWAKKDGKDVIMVRPETKPDDVHGMLAALTADRIAEYAQFFSFGTNDLTQTTFGISRDDTEAGFLIDYLEKGILKENPFAVIDREGVGELMSCSPFRVPIARLAAVHAALADRDR
ncbi:MAG: hypothetical protein JRJ54_13435 [Deltaproteobacteria bacterium]|nr:hypothetical protein [Deltaproteobacteria bacterium]